ncbi:YpoC family protein [Heyndrickxia acidicola]|uniref:YpoC-like domain-containing protein n=1 Tax=Heyndrickxia acidicola TaxID=209389 RepID=A0ABU6MK22_9BACI|nr:hypothetical protein [Heyndrickxia acidicola]MED1205030.1 hypothetical protein [Heyndrickxia acidicola]
MKAKVPSQLQNSFFFPNDYVDIQIQGKGLKERGYFPHELMFFHNMKFSQPWKDEEPWIEPLINEWNAIREELKVSFRSRRQDTYEGMRCGMAFLLTILFWYNAEPVTPLSWREKIKGFQWKAVNMEERLGFIFENAQSFTAFIQLNELIVEQLKQCAKKKVMRKRNLTK